MLNRISNYGINININYMLTGSGLEKTYKIINYEELKIKV